MWIHFSRSFPPWQSTKILFSISQMSCANPGPRLSAFGVFELISKERIVAILQPLVNEGVDSRVKLEQEWKKNSQCQSHKKNTMLMTCASLACRIFVMAPQRNSCRCRDDLASDWKVTRPDEAFNSYNSTSNLRSLFQQLQPSFEAGKSLFPTESRSKVLKSCIPCVN